MSGQPTVVGIDQLRMAGEVFGKCGTLTDFLHRHQRHAGLDGFVVHVDQRNLGQLGGAKRLRIDAILALSTRAVAATHIRMHARIQRFLAGCRQIRRKIDALLVQRGEVHALFDLRMDAHHLAMRPGHLALADARHRRHAHRRHGIENPQERQLHRHAGQVVAAAAAPGLHHLIQPMHEGPRSFAPREKPKTAILSDLILR